MKVSVPVAGATPIDITSMFVGNNINAQVAVYTPTNALYGLQAQDNTKPIKGALYLYDNAREYNGGEASGEGNKAEWYYLRDNIYEKVLEKGYTAEVISDYFAGKKGSDKNDHDKKIEELRSDTAALAILKTAMIKMNEMRSTFKLDPSKSPGFKVLGKNHVPTDNDMLPDMSKASSTLFKKDEATTLLVELIRNKDDTPLIKAYKDSNIEIVLLKWNKSGNAAQCFKENKNLIEIPLLKFSNLTESEIEQYISMEGGNLRVKCLFDPGSKDEWGEGTYAVKVKGTDITGESSNEFAAYDASNTAHGMYIINFLAIGNGPRIRPIRPQGFKNKTFDIEADVSGIDPADTTGSTGGTVYYIIKKTVSGDTGRYISGHST